jgi:hypothetical protein
VTILIDAPLWWFRGERWSHLVSDTSYDELHDFAAGLGIPRRGFQGDHYDIPERYFDLAVAAGAEQVDPRVLVRRLRAAGLRRARGPVHAPQGISGSTTA